MFYIKQNQLSLKEGLLLKRVKMFSFMLFSISSHYIDLIRGVKSQTVEKSMTIWRVTGEILC